MIHASPEDLKMPKKRDASYYREYRARKRGELQPDATATATTLFPDATATATATPECNAPYVACDLLRNTPYVLNGANLGATATPSATATKEEKQMAEIRELHGKSNTDRLEERIGFLEKKLEGLETAATPTKAQLQPANPELSTRVSTPTLSNRTAKKNPLSTLGVSAAIVAFLTANTFFLVSEQQGLHEVLGYGVAMSWMISILMEGGLVLLSGLTNWTRDLVPKLYLGAACLCAGLVVCGVLDQAANHRAAVSVSQSERLAGLKSRKSTLEALEAPVLARISSLDPSQNRTEIARLTSKLRDPANGISVQIGILDDEISTLSEAPSGQVDILVWQRRVAMILNLFLSAFLGSLWSGGQSRGSVFSRIMDELREYAMVPVEV